MIRLFALLYFLLAQGAAAQTVSLRSGDHPGFTRLVVTQPVPMAWDFGRSETGYILQIRGRIKDFDSSTVFDRISRSRLSAVSGRPAEGLLALDVACDCHAIATPFRPGVIVIDFADGPAPPASPFEEMLVLPGDIGAWTRAAQVVRPQRRPFNAAAQPQTLPLGPRRLQERAPLPPDAQRLMIPDARATLLSESLSQELARGIASGAIFAAQPPSQPPVARRQAAPVLLSPPKTTSGPQILTRPTGDAPSREPPDNGIACVTAERLALADWGDARPAALQIAESRTAILSEFDRPDPDAIRHLAKLYLHLGFGAEAVQITTSWPDTFTEDRLIPTLGRLIDAEPAQPFFAGMQGCDGPAALWSVLEESSLPSGTDRSAVTRAFSELPPWLRRTLGPRLAQRFLNAGDLSTSQSLEQLITRSLPAPPPEASLISGQIDIALGMEQEATPKLTSVAQSNSALAPIALATLLDGKISRGEPLGADEIDALESLFQAHKASADGPMLRRTLAQSLIAANAVERAFETIASAAPELYPELWGLLAQRGSDLELARQALAPPPGSLRDLPTTTRLALAKRLTQMGFPSPALSLLEPEPGPEADLLRAMAHLKLRDGRAALRSLAGSANPAAAALRAEALELLNQFEGAQLAWQEAEDEPKAQRLNLHLKKWADLPVASPAELRALAERLSSRQEYPPEPLARAKSQMTSATAVRQTATSFLQSPLAR